MLSYGTQLTRSHQILATFRARGVLLSLTEYMPFPSTSYPDLPPLLSTQPPINLPGSHTHTQTNTHAYANMLKCRDPVVPFNFKREPLYFKQYQFSLLTVYYVLVDFEALDSEK